MLEANAAALAFGGITPADVLDRPVWETSWWAGDATRVAHLRRGVQQAAAGAFVRYEVEVCGCLLYTSIDALKPRASPA